MNERSPAGACLLAILALAGSGAARAQMPDAATFGELERAGYVSMEQINTPLLYPVSTGKPYDARVLLIEGRDSLPPNLRQRVNELRDRDEFKVHEALQAFQPYLEEQTNGLRHARGYLVRLNYQLGEYDFARHRFPLSLQLKVTKPKSPESFHCTGAYDKFRQSLLTACISATNWNRKSTAFEYLAIDDVQQAQLIKRKLQQNQAGFFFVMQADGRFSPVESGKMRFGDFFNPSVVSGIQPARVLGLVLVDFETDEILIAGAMPGARKADSRPRENGPGTAAGPGTGPGTTAPGATVPRTAAPGIPGTAPATQPPMGPATPEESAVGTDRDGGNGGDPAPDPRIRLGLPSDAQTRDLDKLLAVLSYTVYSDDAKIAEARQQVEQLHAKAERIGGDAGRDELIRKRELGRLQKDIEAAEPKLANLQDQAQLKQDTMAAYGLRRQRRPQLDYTARMGKLYAENYALPDGREIVVFRGTDNSEDIMTDLQLGLTPELAAELATRVKSSAGQTVLTGISSAVVKGYDAGHIDAENIGRPQSFKAAATLVQQLVASGIPRERIVLAGHSLGGGYAQYAGLLHRVGQIVAFNPAPLSAQLQKDIGGGSPAGIRLRHYVSYIATEANGRTYDPLSQLTKEYLKLPEMKTFRVIGEQYAVAVCAPLGTPEYLSFSRTLQEKITSTTLKTINKGGALTKTAGQLAGSAVGAGTAGTDRQSAIDNGGAIGRMPGNALGTAAYCTRHPFMCSGKLALGGVASAMTEGALAPRAWQILSAHRMKNLQDAMQTGGLGECRDNTAL